MQESTIKQHQIKYLTEANDPSKNIMSGFIFNFRECDNQTYFVYIEDFNTYKNVAEGIDTTHTYKSKINKSSIPIAICNEIGIEIENNIKIKHYSYNINNLIMTIKEKYKDILNE